MLTPIPGAGAAGVLGAGLVAFLGASLKRGVDVVAEAVQLDKHMVQLPWSSPAKAKLMAKPSMEKPRRRCQTSQKIRNPRDRYCGNARGKL